MKKRGYATFGKIILLFGSESRKTVRVHSSVLSRTTVAEATSVSHSPDSRTGVQPRPASI
jgi:hypothetical protein